jgi:hypothetical protein
LVEPHELAIHRLLASVEPRPAALLVDRVLGPVLELAPHHCRDLLDTWCKT